MRSLLYMAKQQIVTSRRGLDLVPKERRVSPPLRETSVGSIERYLLSLRAVFALVAAAASASSAFAFFVVIFVSISAIESRIS
jgi:hypothetical protein